MNETESNAGTTRRHVMKAVAAAALGSSVLLRGADRYTGPVPPKKDIPYLLHADNLVETEVANASQTSGKNDVVFAVAGETSPARTPLAEPIFLFAADRLTPESLGLYQFDVTGGKRQITIGRKKGKGARVFHTSVRNLRRACFGSRLRNIWRTANIPYRPKARTSLFVLRCIKYE
jgi:hypothetical protein